MGWMQGRAVQEVITMRTLRHPCVLPVLAHFQVGLLPDIRCLCYTHSTGSPKVIHQTGILPFCV
jgi:hypothetical protein